MLAATSTSRRYASQSKPNRTRNSSYLFTKQLLLPLTPARPPGPGKPDYRLKWMLTSLKYKTGSSETITVALRLYVYTN